MTTQEFQSQIIDSCKHKGACQDQFKLLLSATDRPALFLQVLRHNHGWCIGNQIFTPELLLQLDAELLLRGGYATHNTKPVSFQPVEIGDNTWAPFNHGASLENINGSYHDFDEALTLDYGDGIRQPTMIEHCGLASAPNMFGIYANAFGRIFEGKNDHLFFPASGFRNTGDGSFSGVGSWGYSWSSVQNGSVGYSLYFNSGRVYPQTSSSRRCGFPCSLCSSVVRFLPPKNNKRLCRAFNLSPAQFSAGIKPRKTQIKRNENTPTTDDCEIAHHTQTAKR